MKDFSLRQVLSSGLTFGLMLGALGCAKPPTQEITDAENAINVAVQNGATDYAAMELKEAQDALSDAGAKVESKDYTAAKTAALDAKDKAEKAAAAVESNKAAAKTSAERSLLGLKKVVVDLEAQAALVKGKNAPEVKATANELATGMKLVQSEFDRGNYLQVSQAVKTLQVKAADLKSKMAEAMKPAAKKKTAKKAKAKKKK